MTIEFNERNLPKGYVVMGTPGEALVPGSQLNKFTEAGIANKIIRGLRLGYDAIEIDLWRESEIYEPRLYERINRIKDVARAHGKPLIVGVHLPPGIDPAMGVDPYWHEFHKQIARMTFIAGHIVEAKFVLLHSCSTTKPEFSEQKRRSQVAGFLVDHYGRNLGELMRDSSKNPGITGGVDLKSWFKIMYPRVAYRVMGVVPDLDVLVELEKLRWGRDDNIVSSTMRALELDPSTNTRPPPYETLKDAMVGLSFVGWKVAESVLVLLSPLKEPVIELESLINAKREHIIQNETIPTDKKNEVARALSAVLEALQGLYNIILRKENMEKELDKIHQKIKSLARNGTESEALELYKDVGVLMSNAINLLENEQEGAKKQAPLIQNFVRGYILPRHGQLFSEEEIQKLTALVNKLIIPELKSEVKEFINKNFGGGRGGLYYYFSNSEEIMNYWFENGCQEEERIGYHIMAKFMYLSRDHLWQRIVEEELEKKWHDPDVIINEFVEAQKEGDPERIEKAQKRIDLLVAAVGAKYIVGHFQREIEVPEEIDVPPDLIEKWKKEVLDPKKNHQKYMSFYDYCLSRRMHILTETPNPERDAEGEMRLMDVKHHMDIIRAMNEEKYTELDIRVLGIDKKWLGKKKFERENISYTFDFVHMVANYRDPMKQILRLKPSKKDKHGRVIEPGDAYYIGMCHINPPRAQEMHSILRTLSNDMDTIYKWLWALRERGMLNAYFVWEEGGEPGVKEAPTAFRKLVEFLNKGVPYEKLSEHPEFFGIDEYFLEEQKRAWEVHGLDPLRNLFLLPHPDYGLIRGAFRAKREMSPGEEWR